MSQTSLGTCRWINKAHSSTGTYSCSTRGTEIAKGEDQWPPSNWPNHAVPETQMTAPRFLWTFLLYPIPQCTSIMIMTSLNDVRVICSPFQWEKHCACAGELLRFACTSAGIPTNYFLLLCKNLFMFSITPNFEPVTLSPRYFGVLSSRALKLLKLYLQPKNRHVNRPDGDTLKGIIKIPHRQQHHVAMSNTKTTKWVDALNEI